MEQPNSCCFCKPCTRKKKWYALCATVVTGQGFHNGFQGNWIADTRSAPVSFVHVSVEFNNSLSFWEFHSKFSVFPLYMKELRVNAILTLAFLLNLSLNNWGTKSPSRPKGIRSFEIVMPSFSSLQACNLHLLKLFLLGSLQGKFKG